MKDGPLHASILIVTALREELDHPGVLYTGHAVRQSGDAWQAHISNGRAEFLDRIEQIRLAPHP